MRDRYLTCYILGRTDSFDGEVELEQLLERIKSGASVRETCLEIARKTAMANMDAAAKVEWLQENIDTIRSVGGDTEKAWRMYCQGITDALAWQIEEAAIEELAQLDDEEESDDLDADSDDPDDDQDEGDEGDEEDEEEDDE